MKKLYSIILVFALTYMISGCSDEQKVMNCAKDFAKALNTGDTELLDKVYPNYKDLFSPMSPLSKIEAHDSIIVGKNNHYFVYIKEEGQHMDQPAPSQPVLEIIIKEGVAQIINSYNCYFPDNRKVKDYYHLPMKHIMYNWGIIDSFHKPWYSTPNYIYGGATNDKVVSDAYKHISDALKLYDTFLAAYKEQNIAKILRLYPNAAKFEGKLRIIDGLSTEIKEILVSATDKKGIFEYIITSGKSQRMDIPGDIDEVVNYDEVEVSPDIIGIKITGTIITDSYNLYNFWPIVPEDKWNSILKNDYEMNYDMKRVELVKEIINQ